MIMKKNRILWMMAGVATLVVTGCQREDQAPSPLYNPETKEVTAEFVLNVTAADQDAQTKMSAEVAQKANNFRGIDDVHIFAYSTNTSVPYVVKTTGWTSSDVKEFILGTVYRDGQISNADDDNVEKDSRRVLQLSIPVGTNAVLFYGDAISTGIDKTNGKTIKSIKTNPAETEFQAFRRIGTDDDVESYNATARLMTFVINRIMQTNVEDGGSITVGEQTFSGLPALSWQELGAQYEYYNNLNSNRFSMTGVPVKPDPLEEIMGKVYSAFTFIKEGEYRAGSSKAIKFMMENMYGTINPVANATPTEANEANAKRLAMEVIERMKRYFDLNTWEYLPIGSKDSAADDNVIYNTVVRNNGILTDAQWSNPFTGAQNLNDYPYGDFHIPEGAAQLRFDLVENIGTFSYANPNKPLVNYTKSEFLPTKYVYAPELMYYVNSPVRTNSEVWDDTDDDFFPNGSKPWADDANWGAWDNAGNAGKVSSSTRTVAVKDNINYGVALLKTSVAVDGQLYDNRSAMSGGKESDQPIANSSIKLSGVLVGGVNPRYNWQFLRKYDTTPEEGMDFSQFDGVIYDDQIVDPTIPTPAGKSTYTLVYDNYNSSVAANAQNDVYIALEFENQGKDFWGRDNMIPAGSKFYLVSKLVFANAYESQTITWPTDHQIPPIYLEGANAGKSQQIPRIFIQDFMTSVTFTMNGNSLKRAYFTMPDLRSANMSLGLSVDLQWGSGYVFDNLLFH